MDSGENNKDYQEDMPASVDTNNDTPNERISNEDIHSESISNEDAHSESISNEDVHSERISNKGMSNESISNKSDTQQKQPYMAHNAARQGGPAMPTPKQSRSRNKPPKKPMNGWLVAFCVLCGCIAFVSLWGNVFKNIITSGTTSTTAYIPSGDTIDVITVEGTIAEGQVSYNHVWTLNRIDDLMKRDSNKGIMLYVNSPGGGIYESDELYLKLKEYKEKTGRPVYAYMAQTAASGGLYVCMAADKIYANRMTLTGSIGVIMSLTDTTGLQDLIGIKSENIVSGKNKAMGNPLTDEQRDILQSIIDESYEIFVDVVAEGRGLDEQTVKKLADGRVYSPVQAKKAGLIDEIADFDTAVSQMKAENNLSGCTLYYDEQPVSFWQQVMYGISNIGTSKADSDFSTIRSYIDETKEMKLMYMMN